MAEPIKHKTTKAQCPFTQIPNALINDGKISAKAKALYCYLRSKPDSWVFYVEDVKNHFKEGRDAVRGAFKELERLGWLERRQLKEGNLFSGFEIIVRLSPFDTIGQPENQAAENESPENSQYSNTDLNNTDNNIKKINKKRTPKVTLKEFEEKNGRLNIEAFKHWIEENHLDLKKVADELEVFRDKCPQNGYKYACFESAFKNWIRNKQYGRGLEFYKRAGAPVEKKPTPPKNSFQSKFFDNNNL